MPTSSNLIYLDNAAATPLEPSVLRAMVPYFEGRFANPSSLYNAARESRGAVDEARAILADILGAKTTEVVFTSGGTEGDNLAVQGVLRAHPQAHWVTTSIEHDAVLACVEPMQRDAHHATVVGVDQTGIISLGAVEAAITHHTVLVSVMLANNEIGTIQPVAELARVIRRVRLERIRSGNTLPLYLHTDAVQAANYISLHVDRLGIDLMTLAGSKIYGPKGSGLLYVRSGTVMDPLVYGGGQERGRRSGTENVAAIVGLAEALKLVQADRTRESAWLAELRDELYAKLLAELPDIRLNGDAKRRLPNNLNLTIPGAEGEALVLYLDNAGILASTGSACSTGSLDPSHVLLAIGRSAEQANSSLRLSLGRSTTAPHTEAVLRALPAIVRRLREL
jgi:cysteine desulfurase